MAKKNQQQKSREVQKKIQATNPPKQRTAEDMERMAHTVSNALGIFGAMISGIGAFSNAVRKAQQPVNMGVKEAPPATVDGEAVIVSSQLKK